MAAYVIRNQWALGDTVCLSAAIRDAMVAYPTLRLSVVGHYTSFWENNPHVRPVDAARNAPVLHMDYCKGIERSKTGEKVHFASWFHREFHRLIGLEVPVLQPKGDIWLSAKEKRQRHVEGRYWIIVAGGKLDITTKWWYYSRYQKVVNMLRERGITCVQAGARMADHVQPKLSGCVDMVGKTNSIRDLFSLIYHADGVICGVTSFMHIAAAFDKPCVVLAGGREDPPWEAYVNDYKAFGPKCAPVRVPHRFLHTIGKLDCCLKQACWKARTVPLSQDDLSEPKKAAKLCKRPNRKGEMPLAECMTLITPEQVVEAVMSYEPKDTTNDIETMRKRYGPPIVPVIGTPNETPNPLIDKFTEAMGLPKPYVLEDRPWMKEAMESAPLVVPKLPPEFVPRPKSADGAFRVLDNPIIGGKLTICILSWGENLELLHRCLEGIVESVPRERFDIRVALNQPGQASLEYAQARTAKTITKLYIDYGHPNDPNARKKYPAMREMFHDPECPITTKYLLWFDDDVRPVHKHWLPTLAEKIIGNHRQGGVLYGRKLYHDLMAYSRDGHNPRQWFERAPWWKNEMLRLKGLQRNGPNGSCIDFVAGWFWAMSVEFMRRADIPDMRLWHNGGDITIGAQVHQAGGRVVEFNSDKKFLYCPTKEQGGRRGWSEAFPWADPKTRDNHRPGS